VKSGNRKKRRIKMEINPTQDDDRRRPFAFEIDPEHMLEECRRVTYRERGEMENGIEIKEIK